MENGRAPGPAVPVYPTAGNPASELLPPAQPQMKHPMKPYATKILRAGGLLLAVSATSSVPVLSGYDAATGATATTTTPTPPSPTNPHYVAQVRDSAGTRIKGSFTRTLAAKQEKFTGTVKIPLPNDALGIVDAGTAANAELVLELSRKGITYADCVLDFVGLGKKPRTANYKVDLLSRRGSVQQKTGFCQLQVNPKGPGMPQPVARDKLALKAIGANGEKTFASGVFVKK
jgi:hypothetical protein